MPETRAKIRKRLDQKLAKKPPTQPVSPRLWMYAAATAVALYLAFQVYAPALRGPFVFDDLYTPYGRPNFPMALGAWIGGVRPLLMFTYWLNYHWSTDPLSFHVVNVLLHVANSFLVFFIARKVLDWADADIPPARLNLIAGFAAAVFLLHPVQTESVSYIASRSEALSVFFFLGAFAVMLYRHSAAASWRVALAVLALGAAALASKEHTLVLPALLLLTDYYWNPGFSFAGIWRNWRVYVPMALGGVAGLVFVARLLAHAPSAGLGFKEFTWYQYFFTECRAFFVYLRLLVFPVGQTLDYDYPISHSIMEHDAIFGLAAILLLVAAAIYFARRFPLASYGFFVYVLLMAPTSSFVPIKDAVAERRLYLPMIGALLITVELLRHIRIDTRKLAAGLSAIAALLAFAAWQRNQVWASDIALWEDTAQKSPSNARAHFHLARTYDLNGRSQDALAQYAETARLERPNYDLLYDWGLALDATGQPDQALAKLKAAAALEPGAPVYSQIGMVYAKQKRWQEALAALAQAEKLDPNWAPTYDYRATIRAATNDFAAAVPDYQRAVALDPSDQHALQGLAYAQQQLNRPH